MYESEHNWVLKYLKSPIFLSLLSWMRKKKVPLKNLVYRGGCKKMFAGQRGSIDFYNGGWKCFKEEGDLTKEGLKKKLRRVPPPQSDYGLYAMYCTYWFLKFYNVYI